MDILGTFKAPPIEDFFLAIYGELETNKKVTILSCHLVSGYWVQSELCRSSFLCERLIFGAHSEVEPYVKATQLSFEVENLPLWDGMVDYEYHHDGDNNLEIQGKTINPVIIKIGSDITCEFRTAIVHEHKYLDPRKEINAVSNIILSSKKPLDINSFEQLAIKLRHLVCLGLGCMAAIKNVRISLDGNEHEHDYYYQSFVYDEAPKPIWRALAFNLTSIGDDAELVVNNWVNAYEKSSEEISLFFSLWMNAYKFTESRFLALYQSLEALINHTRKAKKITKEENKQLLEKILNQVDLDYREIERLKNLMKENEYESLSDRINEMIMNYKSFFEDSENDTRGLVRKIINTRNYLTHHNKKKAKGSATGQELHLFNYFIESVVYIGLLELAGLTYAQINLAANQPTHLRSIISVGRVLLDAK